MCTRNEAEVEVASGAARHRTKDELLHRRVDFISVRKNNHLGARGDNKTAEMRLRNSQEERQKYRAPSFERERESPEKRAAVQKR